MDCRDGQAQAAVRRAMAAQDLGGRQRALGGHLERVAEARRVRHRLAQDERPGRGRRAPSGRLAPRGAPGPSAAGTIPTADATLGPPVSIASMSPSASTQASAAPVSRVEERARLARHGRPSRAQRTRSAGTGTGAEPERGLEALPARAARSAPGPGDEHGRRGLADGPVEIAERAPWARRTAPDDPGSAVPSRAEDHEVDVGPDVQGPTAARAAPAPAPGRRATSSRRARRSEVERLQPERQRGVVAVVRRRADEDPGGRGPSAGSGSAVVRSAPTAAPARLERADDRGVGALELERDAVEGAGSRLPAGGRPPALASQTTQRGHGRTERERRQQQGRQHGPPRPRLKPTRRALPRRTKGPSPLRGDGPSNSRTAANGA